MAVLLLSNHTKYFKNGRDIKESVEANDWKFSLDIEEQMRFWKDFGEDDIDVIIKNVRNQVEKATLNYSLTSEFSEGLS